MTQPVILVLDPAEHATVRAALEVWRELGLGEPANRSDVAHDIACGLDKFAPQEVVSLDKSGLSALIRRARKPAAAAEVLAAVSGAQSPSARALLENGVVLAERVSSRWESGGLAGAVGALDEWTGDVKLAFPALDYSDGEEDEDGEDETPAEGDGFFVLGR